MAKKQPIPDPNYIRETDHPTMDTVYGGPVKLLDGRIVQVYCVIGPQGVILMEATHEDIKLTTHQLNESVVIGDRVITLQELIVEKILPYYYMRSDKKGKKRES